MVTGLLVAAQQRGGQGLDEVWGMDLNTRRGMVYGLILVVGALVAIMQFQRLLGLLFKLAGKLLGLVKKLALGFLYWNWKVLKELAGWLGWWGKRILIFWACLGFTAMAWWMFGGWVAVKLAAVWILFALTSPRRRRMRQARALLGVEAGFKRLEQRLDSGFNHLSGRLRSVFGRGPTPAEQAAERARQEHERLKASDLPFPEPKPPPKPKPPPAPGMTEAEVCPDCGGDGLSRQPGWSVCPVCAGRGRAGWKGRTRESDAADRAAGYL